MTNSPKDKWPESLRKIWGIPPSSPVDGFTPHQLVVGQINMVVSSDNIVALLLAMRDEKKLPDDLDFVKTVRWLYLYRPVIDPLRKAQIEPQRLHMAYNNSGSFARLRSKSYESFESGYAIQPPFIYEPNKNTPE